MCDENVTNLAWLSLHSTTADGRTYSGKTQPAMVIAYVIRRWIIGDGSSVDSLKQMCLEQACEIGDEGYSGYTRRRA
jgi:hypothetical protein